MRIALISTARYSKPLGPTDHKKFRVLESLGEIFVIGFSQDLRPRRFTEYARFCLLPKLPVRVLRYAEIFIIAPLVALWLIFGQRVQILIAQSPYEGIAAALAKKIAGWLGKRVVVVVESHGDFRDSLFLYRRITFERLYRFFMCRAADFAFRHADVLRAVSRSTAEQLERHSFGQQIVRFPAWTDIEVFQQAGINEEKRFPQNILYAGVLSPLKGVHHLINAFALLAKEFPGANLSLVGCGDDSEYVLKLKDLVEHSELDEQVRFLGAMQQAELADWMREACVLVLPSALEGLGRVIIEAMATGTPVIATKAGGVQEIVRDGVTGLLVEPNNEVDLAKSMRWVLEHPEETRSMGCNARTVSARLFSTDVYIAGYKQICEASRSFLREQDGHASSTV